MGWLERAASIPRWRRLFSRARWEIGRTVLRRRRLEVPLGPELRMSVRTGDVIARILYVRGCFEPGVARILTRLSRPGATVLDVGANIGQMTLLMALVVGDGGTVHAFEPCPPVFEELERNVVLNGLRNVRLNRLGLADRNGTASMHAYGEGRESFSSIGRADHPEGGSSTVIQIPVTTVDAYAGDNTVPRIDLVKLDIEGAELAVLRGASEVLRRDRPVVVFESQPRNAASSGWKLGEMWDLLTSLGYVVFGIYPYAVEGVSIRDVAAFETHGWVGENFVAVKDQAVRAELEHLLVDGARRSPG